MEDHGRQPRDRDPFAKDRALDDARERGDTAEIDRLLGRQPNENLGKTPAERLALREARDAALILDRMEEELGDRPDRGLAKTVMPTTDLDRARTHNYIRTSTGRIIRIEDPRWCFENQQISIRDIGHALAHVSRYGGHASGFYSVAQHSVIASRLAVHGDKLWALLHDAPEAYMGDLVSPLKRSFPGWKVLEREWDIVMRSLFRIAAPNNNILAQEIRVKGIDLQLLGREIHDLLPFGEEDATMIGYYEGQSYTDLDPIKELWTPERARTEFLAEFALLTGDTKSAITP